MSLSTALAQLLAAVEAGGGQALLSADTLKDWGAEPVATLREAGLLKPAAKARSVECHGCEERCYSEVLTQQDRQGQMRAFVVCEVPHKQAEMGRVPVALGRLEQWQCSVSALAAFVCRTLELPRETIKQSKVGRLRLGMLPGKQGRCWITLLSAPLALEIQQQRLPLGECLFSYAGGLALDRARVQALVDREAPPTGKTYQASTDRREAGKAATAAMHQDWRDAYASLKQQHPQKTKTWYAAKIARLPIAQGRDSETIRKQLR